MLRLPKLIKSPFVLLFFSLQTTFAQLNPNFTANITSGCEPLIVNFTDQSTGGATSWFWDFGNGNTSTIQNPTAIYSNGGTYTVKLRISNGSSTDSITKVNYITVFARPTPAFTTNTSSGCPPMNVQFTDNSNPGSGTITSWLWDFGDGNSSTQQNPSHTYQASGNYSVTLFLTNSNGCSKAQAFNNYIQVTNAPIAAFTASPLGACNAPLTVNFTNQSTGSGTLTYLWNFGDGQTSTATNPAHTYTLNGTYDITLTVSNGGACSGVVIMNDYINIAPIQAGFTVNDTDICASATANFTDQTIPTPTSWFWDFGDGTTATAKNPSHTYATPGTYNVKLRVTAGANCTDSVTKNAYIKVNSKPVVSFTANDTIDCHIPYTINFTDNTTGGVSWLWNFGDGQTSTLQNPSHTYTASGNYTVTLTVTNNAGCSTALTKNNYIQITSPQAGFNASVTEGCLPLTVNFTDASTSNQPIISWLWNFGDGQTSTLQNPPHVYNSSGTFTVSLIITNSDGCSDTLTANSYISTGTKPNTAFIANPTVACANTAIQFTNQSTNATLWYWDFGDGSTSTLLSPAHSYNDTGFFSIRLVANNNGCRDTLTRTNYIQILPPVAIFGVIRNCATPYNVQFNDLSIKPDSWLWDFGDGQTATQQHPLHVYQNRGQYIVTLSVTNNQTGCTDTQSIAISITDPKANFSANYLIGCAPLTVTFQDSSTDASNYNWDFGDGATSTLTNPAHTYTIPGKYPVALIITDVNGCSDTLAINNYITVLGPITNFGMSYTPNCSPLLTVNFTDSSFSAAGLTGWFWNFGDGQTSTQQNPSHAFAKGNIYSVSLTVTDNDGCSATMVKNSLIDLTIPRPLFSTPDTLACPGVPIYFTNNTSGNVTYFWDFGDGDTSAVKNPTHTYLQSGNYTVSLTVTNMFGCDSTLVKTNYIKVQPLSANFGADQYTATCPPLIVTFADSSTGFITSWQWDFGDGVTSAVKNPSHVYSVPGVYTVTLIITNNLGCRDTITKSNLISISGPYGTFTFDKMQGCAPLAVSFTANATNAATYIWDFGDGNSGTGSSVTHTYTQLGTFHPVLVLQDNFSCSFTVTTPDSIVVSDFSTPVNAGSDQAICAGQSIPLQINANGQVQWSPVTGLDSPAIANPLASPSQTTTYIVTVTDTNGCVSSDDITISVIPLAVANAGESVTIFVGQTTILDGSVSGATTFNWSPSSGLNTTNSLNPSATLYASATYILTASNSLGCPVSDSVTILVAPWPVLDVPTAFTPNGDGVNDIIYAKGKSIVELNFRIFNRWGQLVFETNNINEGWDGSFRGQKQNMETYIYHIQAKTLKGDIITKSGNITLLQ